MIRWRRGSEVVAPLDFIPLVENTPLSGLITYWVIDTVAQELGNWLRANEGVHISINVPPEIIGRGGLEYAATKSGLMDVAHKFVMEITERGVPDKLGVDALNSAPRYGLRIALDDTGVSDGTLIILSRVRVDIIKIDKSLVSQIHGKEGSPRWMQMLPALMQATDLEVIAEGVEFASQVEMIKKAGIKMAQGWYFSPPLSARAFEAFYYAYQ